MTIDAGRVTWWLGSVVLCAELIVCTYACAGANKIRHGDTLDVSRYPQDIQQAYNLFAVKCSRCHTLARPLNARISDPQHWVRYVARMRLNASSGINAKDGQIILRFLLYYMHQREQDGREHEAEQDAEPQSESDNTTPPSAAPELDEERATSRAERVRSAASDFDGVDTLPVPAQSMAEPGPPEMNP
jgi:hypothetical protein